MSFATHSTIERELARGERVLWKGKPQTGIKLRAPDIFLIPFSLLWGGFALFWEFTALTQAPKDEIAGVFFPLFGLLPFVAMGLYLIIGRFFLDAWARGNIEYALTDKRAIIVAGLWSRSVRSIDYRKVADISLTERSDKSGTISFNEGGNVFGWARRHNSFPGFESQQGAAFDMIDDARGVYQKILKTKET